MEEKIELVLIEEEGLENTNSNTSNNHGWQKVVYPKRQRKTQAKASDSAKLKPDGAVSDDKNVFKSIEQHSEERRRKISEAQRAAEMAESVTKPKNKSDSDGEYSDDEAAAENVNGDVKQQKKKEKKPKKPKVSVADAAAKIDASDLSAFLVDVSASYESQQDIQLMRFADYFGRAFSSVSSSQFPWAKTFRESPVAKIVNIPISHISEAVYKTSVDWINQRSLEALGSFALWSADCILAELAVHQVGAKGSKKVAQQPSSKSQVAFFVVLAMVLRRKPDVLINLLSTLRENSKYQGLDKLPLNVWMVLQASQGDLAVGLYAWAHHLLPLVSSKNCNPQSRDWVLQLVERILSAPKARTILVNGAVRKGERLVSPSEFEILLRVTFPSARVKATERFEAVYPTLKEVALAGSPGSKAMKQVSQQMLAFAVKAAGEGIPELSKEASGIFIWCLTQHPDCYKQWDKIYLDSLEVTISVLRRLSEEWKEHSAKLSVDHLKETLKAFMLKNEKAISSGDNSLNPALFKEADKYCKAILAKLSRGHGCAKGVALALVAVAVGVAITSSNLESLDWSKLSLMLNSLQSSF
ncbi:Transmembrane protein 214 [Dillenia turbinata]|uniref:Transmembrane protein 214 n=1 Tax=Dillenia turbinata TaxID=194707 RepID=A0AAN8Z9D3_9MAGN